MTLSLLFDTEAVLAVCGASGAGKTTALEKVIPRLVARGLSVGLVKHDAHGFLIDRESKDSARLYRAGAEIVLRGPEEYVCRSRPGLHTRLEATIQDLLSRHDLVLVEGHKTTPLPKLWLRSPREEALPEAVVGVLESLPRDCDRASVIEREALRILDSAWKHRPLYGGILVGGKSLRMGGPKQLIEFRGRSFAEIVAGALERQVDEIFLLGDGQVPDSLRDCRRLYDPPGLEGPLAGILAAMRWAPRVAWLIAACDHPQLNSEAVSWLLAERRPGRRAVIPKTGPGLLEPLLAVYEPHASSVLEALAVAGSRAPRLIAGAAGVASPSPPESNLPAWTNINQPDELEKL